jgi:Ecdysteroid kinase-like family
MTTTRASLTANPHTSCGIPALGASVVRVDIARTTPPQPSAFAERIKRATGADTVTLGPRLQSLWGGYGELWRGELAHGGAVTRVVVKHVQPPPGDASRSHRRKLRSYEVEQTFYERYAGRCSVSPSCRVPRPIQLLSEHGGWLFVLEDLDASGFSGRRASADAPDITATLRWLATFHARFLGTPPDGLWKVGTYWQLGTRPDELGQMKHDALRKAAPAIDTALNGARFKTLVHGDAKLENVCFARAGAQFAEVALVDFQYVGGGVGVKDVAYFLSSCLGPRECEALVPEYLDDYFRELANALEASAANVDASELEREWRALFPLAWVDFYRFLLGWAPGQFDHDPYSEQLTREVLARLKSA